MSEVDKSARMAIEAQVKVPIHRQFWRGMKRAGASVSAWWDRQPRAVVIISAIFAAAVLTGLTGWEALNSARGWVMLANGAAPANVAFMAGLSVTIGYVVFHRRASERVRKVNDLKRKAEDEEGSVKMYEIDRAKSVAGKAVIAAVVLATLSLFGVFSNLASKTAMTAGKAEEVNSSRTELQADIIILKNDIAALNPDVLNALLAAKQSQLKSMVAEAKGWGVDNLDPDDGCAADLSQRVRQLCNAANGSVERIGVSAEVAAYEAQIATLKAKQAQLKAKESQLANTAAIEGEEHWKAMSGLTKGKLDPDIFRIWGMFLASMLFLFGAGLGWDELLEEAERRKLKS
jgi:outer membrane murein-binding lipoprotein Lpp